MLRKLGSAKYKLIRVFAYLSVFNAAALVELNGFRWWYILAGAIFVVLYWFENKYGIAGELRVAWEKSEAWQEYKVEFDQLKRYIMFTKTNNINDLGDINVSRKSGKKILEVRKKD